MFTDRAVARQVFEGSQMLSFALGTKAKDDELRGVALRIAEWEAPSEDGKVVHETTISGEIYHPSLSSFGFAMGGFLRMLLATSFKELKMAELIENRKMAGLTPAFI